jgi:signal transduction histidine kinase
MKTMPESASNTELRQLIRQLAQLVEVSVTLNSTLDPNQLLSFIIETAAKLLNCEAASILLYDEKRAELYFTTASGSDTEKLSRIPVPIEGSIAGTIFRENRPLVINDVQHDPRHYQAVGTQVQFQSRSLLGVPMCIREQTTGVLEALNKRNGDFNDADVRILSVVASQAAVAIHNARLVQALQKAYDELSRVDRLKSDFLAIASHELRTPLGVILGYASFLKEEAQGQENISDHADRVMASALRLRGIVEAMTNLNMLQMMNAQVELKPVAIQAVLKTAVEEIRPTAEGQGQKITLRLPERPLMVLADAEKLGQAFQNLLNNAVRFTPECGETVVSATVKQGEIWASVQDQGIGIPKDKLEDIFKEFYQVEDHMTRRYGGLGVGLSIAKGVVELHNGRIWAESEGVGKGARFTVALPLAKG